MVDSGRSSFLRAVGVMVGSIVGVGIFGLPYVFARSGYLIGFIELVLLVGVMTAVFLMYADVTSQVRGSHRFISYMEALLGPRARVMAAVLFLASMFGGLTAVSILGGEVITDLLGLSTSSQPIVTVCVALAGGLLFMGGLSWVARLAPWVVGAILILYGVLIVAAVPYFDVANVLGVASTTDAWLQPYGVLLFSLAGVGAIPEMHDLLRRPTRLPKAVFAGFACIALLYGLFTLVVVGASGAETTGDTFSGLALTLPASIITLGRLLAALSILSIFTFVGMELMGTMRIDFGFPRPLAWVLTVGVPIGLYLLGVRAFVDVLGFVGSIFGGAMGIMIVLAYEHTKRHGKGRPHGRMPHALSYVVIGAFLFGMVAELVYQLFR